MEARQWKDEKVEGKRLVRFLVCFSEVKKKKELDKIGEEKESPGK